MDGRSGTAGVRTTGDKPRGDHRGVRGTATTPVDPARPCPPRNGVPVNATSRVVGRAQWVAARVAASGDNRRVIGAAVLVGFLTLVVKVVAMGREVLVAAKLGTSDSAEAYIAAWVVPGFVSLVISDAVVGS